MNAIEAIKNELEWLHRLQAYEPKHAWAISRIEFLHSALLELARAGL